MGGGGGNDSARFQAYLAQPENMGNDSAYLAHPENEGWGGGGGGGGNGSAIDIKFIWLSQKMRGMTQQ